MLSSFTTVRWPLAAGRSLAARRSPARSHETTAVVQLADTQQCFEFAHPNPDWPNHIDNQRFSVREWTGLGGEQGATVHGLGGYFESRLYGDVFISILPGSPNYSEGMFR